MKTLFLLFIYVVVLFFKLLKPGGLKAVATENLAIRQQLIVATKERHRSPPLSPLERFLFGLWAMLIPKHLSSDNDPLFLFHRWQNYYRGLFQTPLAA